MGQGVSFRVFHWLAARRVSILGVLAGTICLLLPASVVAVSLWQTGGGEYQYLMEVLAVDRERNLPTYFSTCQLLFATFLLGTIACRERERGCPVFYWVVLAAGFLAMSCDEILSFHETLNHLGLELAGPSLGPHLHFGWLLFGGSISLIAAVLFVPFLRQLPRQTAVGYMAAGAVYLGGAVGMEQLDISVTLEEALEMSGIWLFLRALLGYAERIT